MMPFDAAAIWVSGVSGYIDDRGKFHGVVIFNLESDKGESSIDDSVLSAMGYKFSMVTDSVIRLTDENGINKRVTSKPLQYESAAPGRVASSQIVASSGNPFITASQSVQ